MLSISGFGAGGPESRRPAFAPIVHAELGFLDRQARRGGIPHRDLPLSVADTNASLHGLIGVLAALHLRASTGLGQHIDMAMMDASLVTDDQLHYDLDDANDMVSLPNDVWETGAGPILVSADFRFLFRRMTEKLGLADPAGPGATLEDKIAARRAAVGAVFASLADWSSVSETLDKMNIAWGEVRVAADLAEQPTLAHRGSIVQVDDRAGGTRPVPQSPYRFSAARAEVRGPAPHRGEHNLEVLAEWLGLDGAAVAAMEAAGVLGHDPSPS